MSRSLNPKTRHPSRPRVVVLVGPTAVGKSALGLELALRLGGEIVSADSRQIYRYMDIGTAKPTLEEQALVRHHLIDVVNPDQVYTVATFQKEAAVAIEDIWRRGKLPLLVGGTGLYVRAVVEGLVIPRVPPNPALRRQLEERAEREGKLALWSELERVDPEAASRIDPRNARRVVRALEVFLQTGQPISALQRALPPPYEFLTIGLTADRAKLYERIDRRVDAQIRDGLLEETRRLVDMGYDYGLPSMSGLGYRQVGMYLRGEVTLPEAIEILKTATHRFARQQYTWFRLNDPRIRWLSIGPEAGEVALDLAQGFLKE